MEASKSISVYWRGN